MTLSDDQERQILQDLIVHFQGRYGDLWITKLTSNLRPSPIHQIAQEYGVTVSDVRKVRKKLMRLGLVFQAMVAAEQQIQEQQDDAIFPI